jgi:anti-sigma regulatory factor (Ser/Thr protein kinase)
VPGVVELEIPPRRDHLALVRLVVTAAATVDGRLSERRMDDLRLAVSEACANAVDALAATGVPAPIVLRVELSGDDVAVTVIDRAGGFEPTALQPIPGVTEPERLGHERGLGIPLMQSLSDEVTFTRTAEGTEVRLAVRVPERSD